MTLADLVIPPPTPKLLDYPASVTIVFAVIATAILLVIAGRFDATGGVLTLSILVVLTFIGVVVFVLFFTVPTDEATSAVIGALVLAMGAVIAYWLGRPKL